MSETADLIRSMADELATIKVERDNLIQELDRLQSELNELRGAKPEPAGPPPLKEYTSFEDIVWESGPKTAENFFLFGYTGYLHVLVNGVRYRRKTHSGGPDWYHIAHYGVVDVSRKDFWIAPAFEDGVVEYVMDPEVMAQRIRDYAGGLRYGIGNWPKWAQEAFLETHEKPDLRNPGRVTFLTPAG